MVERSMESFSISVVITTFNRADWVAGAVESVLGQSVAPDQVIVVDDGSADATADVLRPYSERIEHIRIENDGTGQTRPLNIGIDRATSEFILLLDSDDRLTAKTVERYRDAFVGYPYVDLVASNWVDEYHDGEIVTERRPNEAVMIRQHDHEEVQPSFLIIRAPAAFRILCKGNFLRSCTGLGFPKPVWKSVDGFDETIKTSTDYNFLFRVLRQHDMLYIDKPLRILTKHHGNVSGAALQRRYRPALLEDCINLLDREIAVAPSGDYARLLSANRASWLLDLAYHHQEHGSYRASWKTYCRCFGTREAFVPAISRVAKLAVKSILGSPGIFRQASRTKSRTR